jgi:hypothetical protein
MAIDRQLLSFMPHTVTIQTFTSKNNYGEDTVGSSRTASAYVEPVKNLIQGNTVNEETRPLRAYISDLTITLRDKITLPDGSAPEIASVEKHSEVLGLEHTVVTFR